VFFKPIGYRFVSFLLQILARTPVTWAWIQSRELLHTLGALGGFLFLEHQEHERID
jgi:xanthosine utilization system XapX-like protein